MAGNSFPAEPPQTPGFPSNPQPLVFEGFTTLNTRPTRPAIEDQELFVCDGFMPLGRNNLRTLWGVGSSFYTAPSGTTITLYTFGNIQDTPICVVFLSNGGIIQVNTDTGVTTTVAAAGTITNPAATSIGVSQWGSEYIVIVADQDNGYFLWDGAIFYQAGTLGPDVDIASDGYGFTSTPTVTAVGGSGSGASFSVTLRNGAIESISVTNAGSGYTYTDSVYLAFSGGGGNTTAQGTAVVDSSNGHVTWANVTNGGTGYTSTTSVIVSGGGGYGASITAVVAAGTVSSLSVVNGGEQYTSKPTLHIVDSNNAVAQATVTTMPFGIKGTAVETFQSRVWIADGSKITFTESDSASSFNPTNGAGAFRSNDSFLKIGFQALKQSNGFLYLLADSSLNTISGVVTSTSSSTGDVTTTFTNQNTDPQIGTPWPESVQVFSRNIVFANSFGVHVSYGGAVTKVSTPLDGFFSSVTDFGGFNPSSAVAVLFGVHVYMLLLPVIDQISGQRVNKLLMWDGQRWWTSQQEITLTQIATQEINSVMTAWGSTGTSLYQLFQSPSTSLTKYMQSKLWANPGYFYLKETTELFGMVSYNTASENTLSISVDSGVTSTALTTTVSPPVMTWTNAAGDTITWTNASGGTITWYAAGLSIFGPIAVGQPGQVIGMTLSTNSPDLALMSFTLVEQVRQTLM